MGCRVRYFVRYLALLVLLGCGSSPASAHPSTAGGASPSESARAADPGTPSEPGHGPTVATPAGGRDLVVARVLSSGPIGSGRCNQCSHQLVVEERISGGIAPSATPFWAHFEWCAGDPEPQPSEVPPCALDVGGRYELELATGTSANFPGERMITSARPR